MIIETPKYRYERKYFLDAKTAAILKARVAVIMRPDAHSGGVYTVNNLYLDDPCGSFYLAKFLGDPNREKYRVRHYNGDLSFIKLEHKVKNGMLSYKETAPVTVEQLEMMRGGDFGFALDSQEPLIKQLGVVHRLRILRPSAEFTYTREAYTYGPGDTRLTFDSRIGDNIPGLTRGGRDPSGSSMLEIKFGGFLPSVVEGILGGLPLVWTEMSKYSYVLERERSLQPCRVNYGISSRTPHRSKALTR